MYLKILYTETIEVNMIAKMDCQIIHSIFNRNELNQHSYEREAQIEAILELSKVKNINFEFLSEICHHPNRSITIKWRDIPITHIRCLGYECELNILNYKQDIVRFFVLQMVNIPGVLYISFLVDFRLPTWTSFQEFILTLNKTGDLFLSPTKINFSSPELIKMKKNLKIKTRKILEDENDLSLLDAINPNQFSTNDFQFFI